MGNWYRRMHMVDERADPDYIALSNMVDERVVTSGMGDEEFRYPSGFTMSEVEGFMEQLTAMVGTTTVSMTHIANGGAWCPCPQCKFERIAKQKVERGEITQAQYAGSDGWSRVYTPSQPATGAGVTIQGDHIYYEPHQPSVSCSCPTCREMFAARVRTSEKRTTRAERDNTIELLQLNYAEGALDDDELSARIDSAMAAKFPSVLQALLLDLPIDAKRPTSEQLAQIQKVGLACPKRTTPDRVEKVLALLATSLALGICFATGGKLLYLMLPISCLVNSYLGIRSNRARGLGPVGWLSGVLMPFGTLLMILLIMRTPKE